MPIPNLKTRELAELPMLPAGTTLATLENGLVLIVRQDCSAPVVSVQAWCKAGSIHEGKWLGAGLSHLLEHMLFKGTTGRGPGKIDQEVQDAGGYINAYTSFDRTVYWINVPDTGAKIAIDILCDVMQNASLPEETLAKEKQVILREMDMNQDDPSRRASRRLFELAYTRSPYRNTVIGYPDIFNEVEREDVVAYYREKYSPNNTFFVVVGNINPAEVETQIREAYANSKVRPLTGDVFPDEPRQTVARETLEEGPVELGHFHIGWHIPEVHHSDIAALDVLATLLGSGRSSRLFQELREKQGVTHSVDAWTYCSQNPGLFGISGVVDGSKFRAAHAAALIEIERLKTCVVEQAELGKAVKQFIAATLATRKTMQGQAQELGGSWIATQDLNFSARYLAAVERLTPVDLQRVACEYLTSKNSTTYALLPVGSVVNQASETTLAVDHPVQKFTLPNGLRLLIKEDHRLPFVEMRTVIQGGVISETADNNGVTLLLAKMLLKGTQSRTAEQIVTEIESVGGGIDSYGGNNSFGVNVEVMRPDLRVGLDLLEDVLLRPTWPEIALVREKEVQTASIRAQRDQLLQSAGGSMRRLLYGSAGYGLDVNGREETVAALRTADLRRVYEALVRPNNAVLAVFGDVSSEEIVREITQRFGKWEPQAFQNPKASERSTRPGILRAEAVREKKQGVIVIGFMGVSIHDVDRYPLELLQEALSDLGSRMFVRIRENLGLAYYVGAQHFLGIQSGYFALYAGTKPEELGVVETEMIQEIKLLREEGLTAEELTRAKAKIAGQRKIARQDLGGQAMAAALDELYGLGFAFGDGEDARYQAVTLADVKRVASTYLNPEAYAVAVVRPEPELSPPT